MLKIFLTFVICGVILQYLHVITAVISWLIDYKKVIFGAFESFLLLWKYPEVGNRWLNSLENTQWLNSICLIWQGLSCYHHSVAWLFVKKLDGGLDPFPSRQ